MKVYIGPYPETGEQETEVRIDDYDVWGMDHTLAKIIEPMLVKLALCKHGAPYVDVEDCPPQLKPTPTSDNHARWTWVLYEMIWAFHQKNYDWEEQYYSGERDTYFEDIGGGYTEMKRGPNDTFKVNHEAMKKHQERMNNGFRLFGKYYENLWD